MKNITEQQAIAVLNAIDQAIEDSPWNSSNFLSLIGQKLCKIREEYAARIAEIHEVGAIEIETEINKTALPYNLQEVYVMLYSSVNSLQNWERILNNLPHHMTSRPIYENEEDASLLLRSKEDKTKDAYVSVVIEKSNILTLDAEKIPLDKFGKELLTIKQNAILLENIKRFVHISGVYYLHKGKLSKY